MGNTKTFSVLTGVMLISSVCLSWAKPRALGFPLPQATDDEVSIMANQSSGCGGVLEAYRGFLSYKLHQPYNNNEKCIWTIKTTRAVILFALMEDGFEPNYDFLSIYNLDKSGALVRTGVMKHGYAEFTESTSSLTFLTFTSDRSTTGQGFLLEYIGFGPNDFATVGELGYTNLFSAATYGVEAFPKTRSVSTGGYAFYSFVVDPGVQIRDEGNGVVLTVDSVDMATLSTGCQHNYFSIHELHESSFDLRLRNCESNQIAPSTVTASSPLLITFYGFLSPSRAGFKVKWQLNNDQSVKYIHHQNFVPMNARQVA